MAQVEYVCLGHRQAVRPKEDDASVNEGEEEQPLQGGYDVNADLGGDVVQPEDPGEQKHGDGGHPEERVDTDHDGDGKAPRKSFRASASLEQAQQRPQDPAPQKIARALCEWLHSC